MDRKAKVLVIDDEDGLRDMLSFALGRYGYSVATAKDGDEGIERAGAEHFDLAILDLKMPKRGGIETLEELKRIDSDIAVIITTGYGTYESAAEAKARGAFDYIAKPYEIEDLDRVIRNALGI